MAHFLRWKQQAEAFLVGAALGAYAAYILGIWLGHLVVIT